MKKIIIGIILIAVLAIPALAKTIIAARNDQMTSDEAVSRLQELKPGAQIKYVHPDRDNGRLSYEGKAVLNGIVYEFEIDAVDGNLREWDRDD